MTSVDELAQTLETHLMPGRIGDAMDLATVFDGYISERVAECLRLADAMKLDAMPDNPLGGRLFSPGVWQPISSVPIDVRVILWFPQLGYPVVGYPEAYGYKTGGWKATHWMPAPFAPEQGQPSEKP